MRYVEETFGVVLFDTAHDAIVGEKLIREYLPVRLMPIPSLFTAGCGIVLRFEAEDEKRIATLLRELHIPGHIELITGGTQHE